MGGELTADARPGLGSTFSFDLTLTRSLKSSCTPARVDDPETNESLSRVHVLLAEDHPTNRKVVELILGAAGVSLHCVEDGAQAVAAWSAGDFDLILMDMQMPVMDGLTATRAIREQELAQSLPRTPIYSLTANALPEHARESEAAGADGHLTKPIAADQLLRTVANAAPRPVATIVKRHA